MTTTLNLTEPTASAHHVERVAHLVAIVGYDGSEPARRAIDAAAELIAGRSGCIEAVFVAHAPVGAELSPDAYAQAAARFAFDDCERELRAALGHQLGDDEPRWRFQRRDGAIARELVAAADGIVRDYDEATRVVIVVGSSMRTVHQVVGSVPVALVRHAKYPVVVVP